MVHALTPVFSDTNDRMVWRILLLKSLLDLCFLPPLKLDIQGEKHRRGWKGAACETLRPHISELAFPKLVHDIPCR